MLKNCAARPAPITTSGVASGKNKSKFVAERSLNSYRVTAIASIVPNTVDTIVAVNATIMELPNDSHTAALLHTPVQLSKVNPCQPEVFLKGSLNEKTNVYPIGNNKKRKAKKTYVGRRYFPKLNLLKEDPPFPSV
jgi:hypothetical protein